VFHSRFVRSRVRIGSSTRTEKARTSLAEIEAVPITRPRQLD
jgi:hypothetical protein